MQETLLNLIGDYGYLGIMLLIFIENVFPPIPSEAVLLFGGFMTEKTQLQIVPCILAATVGSLAGAAVLYLLGRILKKERIKKLFSGKFGKVMRLKPEHVDRADAWFVKYEKKAVLICRCIPVVRSLISIPAGISEMRPVPFFVLTALGSAVWNSVLVGLGAFMGDQWEQVLFYMEQYTFVVVILLAILAIAAVIWYVWYRRKKKSS